MAKVNKQYTNRESQSLDKYLQEIGKVELLDPEEEIDLAQRIKKGDQKSLEKLTRAIRGSSRRRSVSTRRGALSLSRMPCGGSGSRSSRPWPSSPALSVCL